MTQARDVEQLESKYICFVLLLWTIKAESYFLLHNGMVSKSEICKFLTLKYNFLSFCEDSTDAHHVPNYYAIVFKCQNHLSVIIVPQGSLGK